MRAIALVFVLSSGSVPLAQQATPVLPNPDQLFQLPPSPGLNQPNFKLEIPNGANRLFALPRPIQIQPHSPAFNPNVDMGMVVHPPRDIFADRKPRMAQPAKLYPDLKILPTEMANLEPGPSPWPNASGIPIPITWPNAKLEPIPIKWDNFKMASADTGPSSPQPMPPR